MSFEIEDQVVVAIPVVQIFQKKMLEGIDYQCCGYCKNEEICKIRKEYLDSHKRDSGLTANLAKTCGHYNFDAMADPHIWGSGARKKESE